jgi:hypothetical protein
MPPSPTVAATEESGPSALRHALITAFARPAGSIDLSLRDLAILLVTVQHPGQDLPSLSAATGLGPAALRHGIDVLRRMGMVTCPAGSDPVAVTAAPRGVDVVQAMAKGLYEASRSRGLASRRVGEVGPRLWPRSRGV